MNEDIYSVLDMYDRLIVESGGTLGDEHIQGCVSVINASVGGSESARAEVLKYITDKIRFCNKNKQWEYQKAEVEFLREVKRRI